MSEKPPTAERIADLAGDGSIEAAEAAIARLSAAPVEVRKDRIRELRELVDRQADAIASVVEPLAALLDDEDRAVRLSTAKLFVALADANADAVVPVVPSLADRLGDETEFYYVRARSAEALGYVALDRPQSVASPAVLADLRIGLAFDESAVREKLAKALECVAVGHPDRLRHHVAALGEYLADDEELVRYHLTTALVAIGCGDPGRLDAVADELAARLDDDSPQVRGRAAEALGLLASAADVDAPDLSSALEPLADHDDPFVSRRAQFAVDAIGPEADALANAADVGALDGVRATTDDAVEAMTSSPEGECPHCGLALPEGGPPTCPRCGGPR